MDGGQEKADTLLANIKKDDYKSLAALQKAITESPNTKFVNMPFMAAKGKN